MSLHCSSDNCVLPNEDIFWCKTTDLLAFPEKCSSYHDAVSLLHQARELAKVIPRVLRTAEQCLHHYLNNDRDKVCNWLKHCSVRELGYFMCERVHFLFDHTCVTCNFCVSSLCINHMQQCKFSLHYS